MLRIGKIEVNFENREVVKNSDLNLYSGLINVLDIKNESIKLSILNSILLKNEKMNNYTLDGNRIDNLTSAEKEKVIDINYTVIDCNQILIDKLKIYEHIELMKTLFNPNFNLDDIINYLDINEILNQYPNQLSVYDYIKVTMLLSFIKSPKVLILDFSAIFYDLESKKKILNLLGKYANEDKIVLLISCDSFILDRADVIISIESQKFKEVKKNGITLANHLTENKRDGYKRNKLINILKYVVIPLKKNLFYEYYFYLIIVAISLIALSFSYNNLLCKNYSNYLNSLESKELIIYKPLDNNMNYILDPSGRNEAFTDEEIDRIKNINHINSIYWNLFIDNTNTNNYSIDNELFGKEEEYKINLKNEKNDFSIYLPKGEIINTGLYYSDIDYDKVVKQEFNQKGIYISKDFADYILQKEKGIKLKDIEIELEIFVPQYLSYGKLESMRENGERYLSYGLTCEKIKIKEKIAGILHGRTMNSFDSGFKYQVFFEQSDMSHYINLYKPKKSRKVYYSNSKKEIEIFVDELPNDRAIDNMKVLIENVWKPQIYSLFVNDISNINEVKKELNSIGVKAENEYLKFELIFENIKDNQIDIKIKLLGLSILIYIVGFYLIYLKSKKINTFNAFINKIGMIKSYKIKINKIESIFQCLLISFCSAILYLAWIMITNITNFGATYIDYNSILVIVCLTILTDAIIKYLFKKNS